ncbi:hypothetical protein AB0L28_29175 [Streptomyces sp. NPDC052503]|uniref:hypothetical protein n=1 Tax=Streptomyces sp. NPDC052503 TaxID=3156683 RepID=UPI0013693D94|nr:hypothetical protein [Streptomyces sp. SID7834]MYT57988.1 hypothetical protein [Streptomyces sp. SID7834]
MSPHVNIAHGQFTVASTVNSRTEPLTAADLAASNGLLLVSSDHTSAMVITGALYGEAPVAVAFTPTAPPSHLNDWDDVVETSMVAQGPALFLESPEDLGEDVVEIPLPSGAQERQWWRLRLHARGRDNGSRCAAATSDGPEAYLLQLWPSPRASDARLKLTS